MKISNFLIRALIGISILVILILKIDIKEAIRVTLEFGFLIFLLLFVKYLLETSINAMNITILLNASGEKIRYKKVLGYFFVSSSIGMFSPGRLGDLSIIPMLKKEGINYGKGTMVSIFDKLITLIMLVLFSIYGLFLCLPVGSVLKIILFLFIIVICMSSVFFSKTVKTTIKTYLLGKHEKKFKGFSENFFYLLKEKKGAILADFILTIVYILGSALTLYLAFLCAGVNINFLIVVAVSSLGRIIALIPISLSGLGVRESASVYLYSKVGVASSVSGAIYLLAAFMNAIISGLIIILFSKKLIPNKN